MCRPPPLVLLAVDEPLRLTRWPTRLVQLETLEQAFNQAKLIVRIQDLKTLWQPGVLPVGTQQPMRQTMKGAYPHTTHRLRQNLFDAPFHLARRLIGKGHGKDIPRRCADHLYQPGNAMHQDPGFTTAGPRQHQHPSGRGTHRFALGVVQFIQYM